MVDHLRRKFARRRRRPLGADRAAHDRRAVAEDVKTLGTAPFIGGYEVGRGVYEASPIPTAFGGADPSTKRLQKLAKGTWEGVKESSPGQLLHSATRRGRTRSSSSIR